MAAFFPSETDDLLNLADTVGLSRMWGGIHFRSDIEVVNDMGKAISDSILEPFADIIADF